jgi:hypothetical protein
LVPKVHKVHKGQEDHKVPKVLKEVEVLKEHQVT